MSDPGATHLLAIRHGETLWNVLGKQQGQWNTDLSERGLAQAERLAEALSNRAIAHLYSSDLGRARQTAEAISRALNLEVRLEPGLRERHLGVLQGLTLEEFHRQYPAEYALFHGHDTGWVLPGGESRLQFHQRVVRCVEELVERHRGSRVAIVTHGWVLDSLFRHVCGLDLGSPRCFSLLNASINEFSAQSGRLKLEHWGDVHHLRRLGTEDDW